MEQYIIKNFTSAFQILDQFIKNEKNFEDIDAGIKLMSNALKGEKKIFSCGNGGSMSDAMHFAEELTGRFQENRRALAAIAISDPSHITCVANDFGFDYVFSRYIEAHGQSGDILLAISTSGNSRNVIEAAKVAKERNMKVVALTGKDGGKLKELADVEIRAPKSEYSDRIQEIHIKVIHTMIEGIEKELI